MKKLLLTAALLGAATTAAASPYWHKGVTVNGDDVCIVQSGPNEDRHYWIPRLALHDHSVADSIDYHAERSNGYNFHAAAKCWLETRGDALVHMDNGGVDVENGVDYWNGLGANFITKGNWGIYGMSYEDKIDLLNSVNNDIVDIPNTWESLGGSTSANMVGLLALVDGVSITDVADAWLDLHVNGLQDVKLRPFAEGWAAQQGTYVAAQEAQAATYNAPESVGNIDIWFTDLASLNTELNFYLGHTNRQPRNFLLSDDDGETYRISATLTWNGNTPTVLRETVVTEAVEASPAMYGGFPLTDWTESLGL